MITASNGKQYAKGNLHMHTTLSDGKKTPDEALGVYKENGYDFVAITDHWKFGEEKDYNGMTVLSGGEYNIGGNMVKDGVYHIVAIACDCAPELERSNDVQTIINKIHEAGGLACLAHPAWSLNSPDEIAKLHGIDLTEIFNSVSDIPLNCRPYSGVILDILASKGYLLPLGASDDTHKYQPFDQCRSYCLVEIPNGETATKENIVNGIKSNKFFASQGPIINVELNGEKVTVDCPDTPVEQICFFTDTAWSSCRTTTGHDIIHGEYILKDETFVRVEVTDQNGNSAWSQYIKTH